MRHSASDPTMRRPAAFALALGLLLPGSLLAQAGAPKAPASPPSAPAVAAPDAPKQAADLDAIQASEVDLSRDDASLTLELAGGRKLHLELKDGDVLVGGDRIGSYERGDALDRSWRDLLNAAMDTPNDGLRAMLVGWSAPGGSDVGKQLDIALESALLKGEVAAVRAADSIAGTGDERVVRLQSRIDELESMVQDLESRRTSRAVAVRDRGSDWSRPLRYIGRGFTGVLATLALYAVLLGLGFAAVFFGRRYLEGVADTARHHTMRSWAVGLAGSFLALPVFILGIIGLAISIVGIPLLIAWIPLFPVAVAVAVLFGYLAVGHAAGEALAERRLEGSDWFSRGNSYYYLMTGLGLLLALFVAGHVVQIAGPWLGFVRGILMFLGGVLTWAALTIGFGAILLSRGGTRPLARRSGLESEEIPLYESGPHA